MRISTCCSILGLILVIMVNPSIAAQEKTPITEKGLEWRVQNRPWLIQGRVVKVETKLMDGEELTGLKNARGRQLPGTEITLEIEKVITGDYDGSEICILLAEGTVGGITGYAAGYAPMKIAAGDDAIVAIVPDAMRVGCYVLWDISDFFKIDGTHLVPYRTEYCVTADNPLEVIARKAKERQMPELFKAADVVFLGTVKKLIDPGSPSRKIVVSVDNPLKGTMKKSEVTVDVSELYQPFARQKPGYKVLLFLKKDDSGFRPVAGINGYYVVRDDKLSRGVDVPLRVTLTQLKGNIKTWKEVEQ